MHISDQYQKTYAFYKSLDRSIFVDNELKEYSHYNYALPIGFEQTISQPSLVLEMTLALNLNKDCKVLEIGTGSGYQTAFLAEFAGKVYTVERIRELSAKAQGRLVHLGYENIHFKVDDGSKGWKEFSPYDRIMVTAAAGSIPDALIEQLDNGGRLIIPVGPKGFQELMVIEKDREGNVHQESLGEVTFVELKGKYGWNKSINDKPVH